jgi:hypothetical protein
MLGTATTRRTSVRWLAGNLSSGDISDTDLDNIIERGDQWFLIGIGRSSWIEGTDADFETGIQAADYWAASEVLDGIPGKHTEAESKRKAAREVLAGINRKTPEQGNATIPTLYKTAGAET